MFEIAERRDWDCTRKFFDVMVGRDEEVEVIRRGRGRAEVFKEKDDDVTNLLLAVAMHREDVNIMLRAGDAFILENKMMLRKNNNEAANINKTHGFRGIRKSLAGYFRYRLINLWSLHTVPLAKQCAKLRGVLRNLQVNEA